MPRTIPSAVRGAAWALETALRRLGACSESSTVLDDVVAAARALLDAPAAWIGGASAQEPQHLRMLAHVGLRTPELPAVWELAIGQGVGGSVAATGQPLLVRDYRRDPRRVPRLKSVIDLEQLRSGVVVALPLDEAAVLYVASRQPHRFDEADLTLADAFARTAAAVVRGVLAEAAQASARRLDAVATELQLRLLADEPLEAIVAWLAHQLQGEVRVTGTGGVLLAVHTAGAAPLHWVPLDGHDQQLGVLEVGGVGVDTAFAGLFGGIIAMDLRRQREREATTLRLQADFLYDLLDGRVGLAELRQRAGLLGFDLAVPRSVVRVGVRAGGNGERPVTLTAPVLRALDAEVRHLPGASVVLPDRTDAWIVMPSDRVRAGRLATLLDAASAGASGLALAAGVGRPCKEAADYRRSREDADLALQIARARSRQVVRADDLGAWRVLAPAGSPSALRERAEAVLTPLLEADAQHGRDDIGTLRMWLAHDRHVGHTAEALHIHENTLRYRLQRIAELLVVDLRDPDARFPVDLAVRTLELLQAGDD